MKRIKYFLLAAVIAALDQIIKFFIRKLPEGQAFFSASPFFELRHVTNTGAAFSLLASRQSVIVLISVLLTALLCLYLAHEKSLSGAACTAVSGLIGGGMGNLLDRFFFGCVTDYIKLLFIRFPIFNFADCCVVIGALLLLIFFFFIYNEDKNGLDKKAGRRDKAALESAESAAAEETRDAGATDIGAGEGKDGSEA